MHSKKLFMYVVLFSLGSILCFFLATYLIGSLYVYDVQRVETRFTVMETNTAGFNLNTTALTFGKVPRGGSAERTVTLRSNIPTIAKISFEPKWLGDMIFVSNNSVPVNSDGTQIVFSLVVPQNATVGNYTGTITTIYLRKMPWE